MISVGISCFYHDSAVCFVDADQILFAITEERLSRKKHDRSFPQMGYLNGLQHIGLAENDIDRIVFYEDPNAKLERLFDFSIMNWPRSRNTFFKILPRYYFNHYPVKKIISEQLLVSPCKIQTSVHHHSHAAACFYTSPFEKALVVTVDGVGEKETIAAFIGQGNRLTKIKSVWFPDSLGLLYSVFTHYLGFKPNSGEYKVMGLAPYGEPEYADLILKKIITIRSDGYPKLNLRYFDFDKETSHFTKDFIKLFGRSKREPEESLTLFHKNLAASIQLVIEKALFKILEKLQNETGQKNLCFGGGVALNCSFNGKLLKSRLFDRIHIHNACGDDAGALGAAISGILSNHNGSVLRYSSGYMPYLGMEYTDGVVKQTLNINQIPYVESEKAVEKIASALAQKKVVAVFHGRDEWGPRALGNRSILADPRSFVMKDTLNSKIKFREEFRPFAPVAVEEEACRWFDIPGDIALPDMLYTVHSKQKDLLQAVTHVNGTARLQTINEGQNPFLYRIIKAFSQYTGVPVLINTSFNLRGEPIVGSPSDALSTFAKSNIDLLVMNQKYMIDRKALRANS